MGNWKGNEVGIYSNDGATMLWEGSWGEGLGPTLTVTENGVTDDSGQYDPYVYVGVKTFVGLSLSSGANTPDYKIGDKYINTETPNQRLYIVEEGTATDPDTDKTTVTYNGETIAELSAGQTATLHCADKAMAGDVVVTAGSGGGGGGIIPSGTLDITENGTYDVTEFAAVDVNVPTSVVDSDNIPFPSAWKLNDTLTKPTEFDREIVVSGANNIAEKRYVLDVNGYLVNSDAGCISQFVSPVGYLYTRGNNRLYVKNMSYGALYDFESNAYDSYNGRTDWQYLKVISCGEAFKKWLLENATMYTPALEEKMITTNGHYLPSSQYVGFSKVYANTPFEYNGQGCIPLNFDEEDDTLAIVTITTNGYVDKSISVLHANEVGVIHLYGAWNHVSVYCVDVEGCEWAYGAGTEAYDLTILLFNPTSTAVTVNVDFDT